MKRGLTRLVNVLSKTPEVQRELPASIKVSAIVWGMFCFSVFGATIAKVVSDLVNERSKIRERYRQTGRIE